MSTAVLPSLAGLGIDIERTPVFDTIIQQNTSGKEVRIPNQEYPRWRWNIMFNVLRSANGYTELQQLVGFFNARKGRFDTFLFTDADDNSVTLQNIGVGNGVQTIFQLVRSFGGFTEPVLAPNVVAEVYVNGVLKTVTTDYTISNWGSSTPGVITFVVAPPAGQAITVTYTYYWPVRMENDEQTFAMFLSRYYRTESFTFISVKN